MAMTEYTWCLVLAIIFSFIGAFGIGANDVANAFATSVGAKSITVKQAVVIAAIFEFSGAFFMGSHVAKTIRKGICDYELFQETENDAGVLLFGMMCVTFSVAVWLLLATYLSLPVSTTHTCVGSVMGMAIAAKGWNAVDWSVVSKIILSWFFSPIFSGIFAVAIWKTVKYGIMYASNPRERTMQSYPVLVAFCVIIVVFYTIFKGTPQLDLDEKFSLGAACGISFGCGAVAALATYFLLLPWLEERLDEVPIGGEEMEEKNVDNNDQEAIPVHEMVYEENAQSLQEVEKEMSSDGGTPEKESLTRKQTAIDQFTEKFIPDIEKRFKENIEEDIYEMLEATEKFDAHAELGFSYLQVMSACFDAFAHGANDVANSVGPMAAVFAIWKDSEVEKKVDMPLWILAMGGVGIVVGLALYGYNIIEAIGLRLTKLSPSRGFSIELGAALVVLTGSRLEIPLSTTHCQVGATVGVGMSESCYNVNWKMFAKVAAGWIVTLVVAALVTAAVFSYAVYAPCV